MTQTAQSLLLTVGSAGLLVSASLSVFSMLVRFLELMLVRYVVREKDSKLSVVVQAVQAHLLTSSLTVLEFSLGLLAVSYLT